VTRSAEAETHLFVGSQLERQEAVDVAPVRRGARLEQHERHVAVRLCDCCGIAPPHPAPRQPRSSSSGFLRARAGSSPHKRPCADADGRGEELTVMQRAVAHGVGPVDGAAVLEQQAHERHAAHGGGAVQRQGAAAVLDARGGAVREELPREREVGLGGAEVQRGLAGGVCVAGFARQRRQGDGNARRVR